MNAKKLILSFAVLAASASASAFAGDIDVNKQSEFVSTKSRAEVKAELAQARAEGLQTSLTDVIVFTDAASAKTRDDVRREALRSAKVQHNSDLHYGG
jgi:hypothetical protein